MEDCGEESVCLGLEIRGERKIKVLHLSPTRYAENVLEHFGVSNSKPVVTPMDGQLHFTDR